MNNGNFNQEPNQNQNNNAQTGSNLGSSGQQQNPVNQANPNQQSSQEGIVIGQVEKNVKQKSPVGVLVFFGFLIVFVIALPYITELANNILKGKKNDTVEVLPNEEEQKEDEGTKIVYYDLNSTTKITLADFNIENIGTNANNGYTLTFDIINPKQASINFAKLNYYIELYSDNTLTERLKLNINKIIAGNSKDSVVLEIQETSFNSANKIVFMNIDPDSYPVLNLEENDAKESSLTCIKSSDVIIYNFKEQKLTTIDHTLTMNNMTANYQTHLIEYTTIYNNYSEIDGYTVELMKTDSNFNYSMKINLKSVNPTNLNNFRYYKKDTEPRTVKFELEATGYTCN